MLGKTVEPSETRAYPGTVNSTDVVTGAEVPCASDRLEALVQRDGYGCLCVECMQAWRQHIGPPDPMARERSHLRRVLFGYAPYLAEENEESWRSGGPAAELDDYTRDEIRRYYVGRVIAAGGGRRALALLHKALDRAENLASEVSPYLADFGPEDYTEWEYEGDGGYILNSNAYEYLQACYQSEWEEGLESLFLFLVTGYLRASNPEASLTNVFRALVKATAQPLNPARTHGAPTNHHHNRLEGLAPIQRTGPPARAWALPQVLPMAA
jgi:hypothetical protein